MHPLTLLLLSCCFRCFHRYYYNCCCSVGLCLLFLFCPLILRLLPLGVSSGGPGLLAGKWAWPPLNSGERGVMTPLISARWCLASSSFFRSFPSSWIPLRSHGPSHAAVGGGGSLRGEGRRREEERRREEARRAAGRRERRRTEGETDGEALAAHLKQGS